MVYPEIPQVPGEVCAELVSVIRLDSLYGHGEPASNLVHKVNRILDGEMVVDFEDSVAGGLIDRGELVEAARVKLQVLHVNLNRLPWALELSSTGRSRPVAFLRDAWHPVAFENLEDGIGGNIGLVESAQVEADSTRTILALLPNPQDQSRDVRRRGERMVFGPRTTVAKPLETASSIAPEPDVVLAP